MTSIAGTTEVISESSSASSDTADGSSSSTGAETTASSTGAASSSTGPGCERGTEGCGCADGVCGGCLVCDEDDVCVPAPNCPQERSEPNDTPDQAFDLGEFNDFDPTFEVVDGRIPAGSGDEDWFSYRCDDNAVGQVDMAYEIDTNIPVRVCQFFACDLPDNPSVVCPAGSEAASMDGLPGCCSDLETLSVEEIVCNPDSDETGEVFVRVDMPAQEMCVSYDLGVHC